jgi:hypothetical protein
MHIAVELEETTRPPLDPDRPCPGSPVRTTQPAFSKAPVTFAAGSAVLAPDMEEHLLRVADVLRRSPFVNLTLTPAAGLADMEALRPRASTPQPRASPEAQGPDLAERLDDLARRRVDATREWLVSVEGIPAERLTIDAPSPDVAAPPSGTAGGVRLTVVASDR